MSTLIDLIRHGEPEGGRMYRGHNIDHALSEKGWNQMWKAVGEYNDWGLIVSSPLQRCEAFARALGEKYNIPVLIEPDFKEIGFGSWEGKTPQELQTIDSAAYEAFYKDPVNARPEGAEDLHTFIQRVTQAYQKVLHNNEQKQTLIVSHAGVMRAIIAYILNASPSGLYRIKVGNAGLTRISHGKHNPTLEFINRHSLP